jgi:hypothetical protein
MKGLSQSIVVNADEHLCLSSSNLPRCDELFYINIFKRDSIHRWREASFGFTHGVL